MALEIKIPAVGESITEVTIGTWFKKVGDYVEMDDPICELESDKATFEVNAEQAGKIVKTNGEEGDTLNIGDVVCEIDTTAEAPAEKAPKDEAPATANEEKKAEAPKMEKKADAAVDIKGNEIKSTGPKVYGGIPSPAAKKILDEKGIDPAYVEGTGRDGRITKEDAMKVEKPAGGVFAPTKKFSRDTETKKMSGLRKAVARRLVAVKNETAMLTTFNEINMKPIMDIRAKYKDKFKATHEVGLGFMSFFTKAVCEALKEFPSVNGMIDGDEMIFHDYCDISIAVSAPRGLVVPVIRNAESLDFAGIEKEVMRLATKARDNKIELHEMEGGTFTITNGGVFGSMMSTPIINPPQSAILGMHNIVQRPIVENGEIVIRPMMYVALSYDHRIIDGRESVGFLVKVKERLENPERLMTGKDPVESMLGF